MIDFHMPGLNAGFASGTEGWHILLEILSEGVEKWKGSMDDLAIEFLNNVLPEKGDESE